jgi:hypothetical protein
MTWLLPWPHPVKRDHKGEGFFAVSVDRFLTQLILLRKLQFPDELPEDESVVVAA